MNTKWPVVPLGELCDVQIGKTPTRARKEYWGAGSPWLSIADMNQGWDLVSTKETITQFAIKDCNCRKVEPGTALLSFKLSVGKVGIARIPMYTNEAIAHLPVRDRKRVEVRFLCRALLALDLNEGTDRAAMGATLNKAKLNQIRIPLPPIEEQRRIADILHKAHAGRANRQSSLTKLDDLAQSIFFELFGDPVTNPKGWPEDKLLADCTDIMSGITKGRKLPAGTTTRKVPYLAVVNVQDRRLDLNTVKVIEATEGEISRYRLKHGDLLLTEGGDPDKLGRGSLWNDEISECIHQNHIFRVRVTDDCLTPLFLNWLVGSERGKRYFLKSAKQTTGIASINLRQLRAFPLLTPPLALQQRFSAAIESVSAVTAQVQESFTVQDSLFASLQYRAFRGEL